MTEKLFLADTASVAFTKKDRTLYFVLLFFFFALYMPGITWLYNVAMWMVFIYSFFYNSIAEKLLLLKHRKALLFIMLFFVLNCASALFSNNVKEGISWVGIRISLLVFPLALGSIYINRLLKERVVFCFVYATCMAAAGCLVYGMMRAVSHHDWSLLYNDNLSDLLNLQSIYFAVLINIALIFFAWLQIKKSPLVSPFLWWPVLLILLPVHFLLASRNAIILLYNTVFIFSLYTIVQQRKILKGLILIGGLLITGLLFFLIFPKTLNRFKEIGYTHFEYSSTAKESHFNAPLTPEQWNGANIRIAVWKCAWTVTQNHFLLGTRLGDKMDSLKNQYAQKGFVFAMQTNRNVHNTYLDVWMSMGLIGLLIFIIGVIILPVADCIKIKDWFGLLVLIFLFVPMFTETYIDRTVGNTILSFFLSFVACYKQPADKPTVY